VARSIKSQLGAPPEDSLKLTNWMQRALALMAGEVLVDRRLTTSQRRAEMLKIADRIAKLRDTDRLYAAEQLLRGADQRMNDTRSGPELVDAPDFNQQPHPVPARRGRPPRSAIR
jgi:hypothetical protein